MGKYKEDRKVRYGVTTTHTVRFVACGINPSGDVKSNRSASSTLVENAKNAVSRPIGWRSMTFIMLIQTARTSP